MAIISFLSLNSQEITEQGRELSDTININASEVELDSGSKRRYYRSIKRTFSLQWQWLPSLQNKTIDNRKGRDYLKSLTGIADKITMTIKIDANDDAETIDVYLQSYSEDLLRRSPSEACDYYQVNMVFEEI